MIQKESGMFHLDETPRDLVFFRETRLCLVEEGQNEQLFHVRTVALASYLCANSTEMVVDARIIGEDEKNWRQTLTAKWRHDEHLRISVPELLEQENQDVLLQSLDVMTIDKASDAHESILGTVKRVLESGGLRPVTAKPTEDQSAYAW